MLIMDMQRAKNTEAEEEKANRFLEKKKWKATNIWNIEAYGKKESLKEKPK